jgi:hypothetical protein
LRLVAVTALFAAFSVPALAEDAGQTLPQLMQRLSERRHGHATFVERQFIAILDRPLESSGELLYDAPDRLEKRTLAPKPEDLVLDKGTLSVRRGAHSYALALRDYPQIAPFIDSIRATLAGDLAALEHTYAIRFEEGAGGWTLLLVPREATLAALIARIRMTGTEDLVLEVTVERTDGDRSVMTIRELVGS